MREIACSELFFAATFVIPETERDVRRMIAEM